MLPVNIARTNFEIDRHRHFITDQLEGHVGTRTGTDQLLQIAKRNHRLAIDRRYAITDFEPTLVSGTPFFNCGQHRGRPPGLKPKAIEQHARFGKPRAILAHIDCGRPQEAILLLERQGDGAVADHFVEHGHESGFPVRHVTVTHLDDPITVTQPGFGGIGIRGNVAYCWLHRRNTIDKENPVGQKRKQEIKEGTGQQNQDSTGYRSLVKSPALVLRVHRFAGTIAFTEKLDVAAERDRGNTIFGLIPAATNMRPDGLTEAHRKAQDLHATPAADNVVTVLVHRDQDTDRHDECQQISQCTGHHVRQIPAK